MEKPEFSITSPDAKPFQVLLVEDDLKLHEVLWIALEEENVTLSAVPSAREGLALVSQTRFDLVILDLGLPDEDGFNVLKAVQPKDGSSMVPVIILTARDQTEFKLRSFEMGAVDYVTKPFGLAEFVARIRGTLRNKRLQDELAEANKKLNEARIVAEESARAKSDFLASMSHEIRTPMNGVIAMTGLLLETELKPEQQEFVETIRTSGEALLTIINDILNISKIQAGKLELEHHPFNLRDCIEDALDILAAKASEKQLDMMYEVATETPRQFIGDTTRLGQILVNLVGNAIKFTPKGEIVVEVKSKALTDPASTAQRWELDFAVRDTGIGIPPDRLNKLFRTFSQVDSSVARHYGGTGLGLAISKALVELMGGKIWVESVEGQGSTFRFVLPLEAVPVATPRESSRLQPQFIGKHLLVIDDNSTHCRILSGYANRWGLLPHSVTTVLAALEYLAKTETDLVLLDMQMPEMQTPAIVEQFRSVVRARTVPVLGMTCLGNQVEGASAPDCLASASVSKPVKPAQLRETLLKLQGGTQPAALKPAPQTAKLDVALSRRIPLRVLLVDDNIINQKVAVRLLKQLGYTVDIAINGLEAVRAVERKPFDLVFMDVQMPVLDGLEATRQIRRLQQQPNSSPNLKQPIYIIAMTANAMQGDREKCLSAGMDDYLPKPIRPEAVQSAIEKLGLRVDSQLSTNHAQPSASPSLRVLPSASPSQGVEDSTLHAPSSQLPLDSQQLIEPLSMDMERLMEFSGGSQQNFIELVTLYLKQTTEQIASIRVAYQARDAARVSRLAHSCAGASSTCGMMAIVPLLRKLEVSAADGDLANAPDMIEGVDREFARIKAFLENYDSSLSKTEVQLKVI